MSKTFAFAIRPLKDNRSFGLYRTVCYGEDFIDVVNAIHTEFTNLNNNDENYYTYSYRLIKRKDAKYEVIDEGYIKIKGVDHRRKKI